MVQVCLTKSIKERVLHAVLFEVIANVIIAVSVSVILNVSLSHASLLSVASAITAMLWNYVYNYFFDKIQKAYGFHRGAVARILHAIFFEAGLIIFLTPVAMYLLRLPLAQALMVEAGLVLFFLPYSLAFNWIYDYTRWKFSEKYATR
ncbi:MAG: PACE efflux transporter [Enterobacter sp.]|jgi:uncharacterized membrane protein|nr:PACE efflux transporter [Enterobacter sp.]